MITKVKYDIDQLKKSNDEELVGLIYNKACELEAGTFGQSLEMANPAMRELFATWILDAEVKNGGFDQFLSNNGVKWAEYAKDGLQRISAKQLIELVERAIKIYKNQSDEFADKRNPEFDTLDDEFYDYDQLEELQLKYIKENYEKFIVTG